MPNTTDSYSDESLINESLQSEATGGVLQNEIETGSSYYPQSRTTSTDYASGSVTPKRFDYTTAKKAAGTNGRVAWSQDGTTYRNSKGEDISAGAYELEGSASYIDVGSTGQTVKSVIMNIYPNEIGDAYIMDLDTNTHVIYTTPSGSLAGSGFGAGYVNGRSDNLQLQYNEWQTIAATTPVGFTASDLDIGRSTLPLSYFWGEIGEVLLFAEELTADEVWDYHARSIYPYAPVGHWRFNGDLLDSSGNGNHGTAGGAPLLRTSWDLFPPAGHSMLTDTEAQTSSFDGINDYVTFGVYDINTDPISLSFWAKPNFNNKATVAFKLGAGSGVPTNTLFDGVQISFWSDGKIYANFRDTAILNTDYPAIYTGYSANTWYHVAQVIDRVGQTNKLYVNGVLAATTSITPIAAYNLNSSTRGVTVGCRNIISGPERFFDGEICNVAVWNDVRTAGEIAQDYERGCILADANLQKYWPLAGDYLDKVGSDDGTNNGSTIVKDISRPQPEEPTSQSITLTGFPKDPTLFYRHLFTGATDKTFALDAVTLSTQSGYIPQVQIL